MYFLERNCRTAVKVLLVFVAVISAVMLASALSGYVYADDASSVQPAEVIRVAHSQGQRGIQKALDRARDNASADHPYEVVVEAGTYRLNGALHIYSNTKLTSEPDVLFKEKKRDNLLKVGTPGIDSQAHGFYYQNITINGGSWDRCRLHNSTGIKIAHAKNVTLENAELCNAENSHLVETAGVDGLTIRNCRFHDSDRTVSGNAGFECVQIDVLAKQHFSGYEALDSEIDYVSKNITIENCSFDHIVRTVGSHTAVLGRPFQNVVFKNNTVTNCDDAGFYMRNVQGLQVSGNHIRCKDNGIAIFNMVYTLNGYFLPRRGSRAYSAYAEEVNGVIENNTIESSKGNGIYLLGRRITRVSKGDSGEAVPKGNYYIGNIKVKNNTIKTRTDRMTPILVTDGRNISISSNKITGLGKNSSAIYITDGSSGIRVDKNRLAARCYAGICTRNRIKTSANIVTSVKGNYLDVKGGKFGIRVSSGKVSGCSGNTILHAKKKFGVDKGSTLKA